MDHLHKGKTLEATLEGQSEATEVVKSQYCNFSGENEVSDYRECLAEVGKLQLCI